MATRRTAILLVAVLATPLVWWMASDRGAPRWQSLAEAWNPRFTTEEQGEGWWGGKISASAWTHAEEEGEWVAELPFRSPEGVYRLTQDDADIAPERFRVTDGKVYLDGNPGEGVWLRARFPTPWKEDGRWRKSLAFYTGDAISLMTGVPQKLQLDCPPASALRWHLVGESLQPGPHQATLSLSVDGEIVWQEPLPRSNEGTWHEVVLPAEMNGPLELEFSLEGSLALAALLAPTLGPAQVERDRANRRPDLVLFLADTFRADNLEAYGGTGNTPNLDRLASESLVFEKAWSTASWTLPSQASMFTGLYPPQHGATQHGRVIPSDLVTLAERLQHHGYRTGAITDAGFVSGRFGFAQGFEWFADRTERNLRRTLDEASRFLAADDGRPVFLFVQTYRAHHPYRVGPEESTEDWDRFFQENRDRFDLPVLRMRADDDGGTPGPEERAERAEAVAQLKALYDEGVASLDAEFGTWFDELEEQGFFDTGYLIWTSDHGEAFEEHGDLWHGGLMWQELIRIPLLVHGGGLEAGSIPHPASLIDVPRSFCALAGVPPDPSWQGRALFELAPERRLFGFGHGQARSRVAILDGDRKILALSSPESLLEGHFDCAFDLETDPGEQQNLKQAQVDWPAELCRDAAPDVERLSVPLSDPTTTKLENDADLKALGYTGEED